MSRKPRLPNLGFGLYYFSRMTAKNRKLFANQEELDRFRELLLTSLASYGVRIHFVTANPYGMHLGLRAGESPISRATGGFCQKYARAINRLRGDEGPLFRPHAILRIVEPGNTFIGLGRCIHYASDLEKRAADAAGRSSDKNVCQLDEQCLHWSTRAVYLSAGRMLGVDASAIRRMAASGSRDREEQHRACVTAFDRPPTVSEIESFTRGSPEDPRFIGGSDFIAAMCHELGVEPRPRPGHYPKAEAEMHRITVRLIEAFRRIGDEHPPAAVVKTWHRWKGMVTIENVCSESRKQPLPMLRGLAASYMRSRGIPQRRIESFLCTRHRTLTAGRRRYYEMKPWRPPQLPPLVASQNPPRDSSWTGR